MNDWNPGSGHCRASGWGAGWRGFFQVFFALLLLPAGAASIVLAGPPKNVIFCIGDGMGFEQVKAANYYNGGPLAFELFPYQGQMTTYSANNSVTDSAASGTALATGYKVNNGVVSEARPANAEYPVYGSEMETLLEYFRDQGKSTGLLTTTYITHATPATFGAHTADRNNLSEIASDYLNQTRPNVLFGGGANGMSPSAAAAAGYTVVISRDQMQGLNTETETMVSGQFGSGYLPYEYDGVFGSLPHLSQMTSTALDILDNDPDGFFLMIEGGTIDQAGHDNNIQRNIRETIEFGVSVQQAIAWAAGRTDTLIIVTADHETGGLRVLNNPGPGIYPSVSWSTGGHTAANVPVYAWGPNAELISGVLDNTYLFQVCTAVLSISLTWDEKGPGNWDQQRWIGDTPPYFPGDNTLVEVKTDTVTVAADGAALTLTITSGGVLIGPGAALTVGQGVDVAAGATLDVVGTLATQLLTTAGTSTVAGGASMFIGEGVTVAAGAALEVAGTLGAKSLSVAGTSSIAGGAGISISEGVAVAAGATLDVAGTLNAKSLSVAGTSTIAGGASISIGQHVEVAAGAALDLAGTLAAQSLTTAGAHLVADGAVLSVADSLTLDSSLDLTGATLTTIPQVTAVQVNQNGVLTLDQALAAGELNVAGRVQAAGAQVTTLNVTAGGLLMSSADVIAQDVNVSDGAIHLTDGANLSVAAMQVTGGTVNTGTGHVVVGQRLKIGNHATIDVADATFQVSSSNLADPLETDNFTLSGGRLTISEGVAVPPGAIAFWRLAEGQGLIAADSSTAGNDHFGTINGADWVSDDPEHGTVLRFDGDGDYLQAANTGDIRLGTAYTIAMWIKTSQKGVELLGKGDGDQAWEFYEKALYVDPANGQVAFTGRYSGTLSGTTNVADGYWHHVAVTFYTLNDQEIYLDGAKDTATRGYLGTSDPGDVLRLGSAETNSSGGYREYVGLMDDVCLYDRRLTAAEVADLYQAFGSSVETLRNMNLRVMAASTLHLEAGDGDVILGNLALEPGVKLKVTGATVSFQDLNAGHLSSVEGDVSVTGTLSPGDSPGRLNVVGSLQMDEDSTYQWELGVSAADLVAVEGDLRLADGWTLRLGDAGGTCSASDQFDLFTYTGSLTLGTYLLDPQQVEASGRWNCSCAAILHDGSRVYLTGLTVVPEPGTMALAAIAVLGVLVYARRKRCPV